jgi:uncharacterized damage-inducible protein DinB
MAYSGRAYAQAFMRHRGALLAFLDSIPEDKVNFRAWEGGMTLLELLDHLAHSGDRVLAMSRGEAPPKPTPATTLAEVRARLQDNAQQVVQALEGLTEEQLNQTVEAFGGRRMPVFTLLDFLREHEAHHKGQIWLMARMLGLEPPRYVKLG